MSIAASTSPLRTRRRPPRVFGGTVRGRGFWSLTTEGFRGDVCRQVATHTLSAAAQLMCSSLCALQAVLLLSASVLVLGSLVPTSAPSPGNYLRNPSFERTTASGSAPYWQAFITDFRYVSSLAGWSHDGAHALVLGLSAKVTWLGVGQIVRVDQTVARPLVISGWARARGVTGRAGGTPAALYADVHFVDGTSALDYTLVWGLGTFGWRWNEMLLAAPKPISVVVVYFVMSGTEGTAAFDDLRLHQAPASVSGGGCAR